VAVFQTRDQAVSVFGTLFRILLQDPTFTTRMRAAGISLHMAQTKPDLELYVDPDRVLVDEVPGRAAIRIRMSCDTAHALWLGKLLMPVALGTGKVRIRGSVAKVLEFVPLLQPAFDRYPQIAAEAGIPA